MDSPDLQRAMAQGINFFWLLEIVPGNGGNAFANQIIIQSDKPNGMLFALHGASTSWRPGWWCITQQPNAISVCFAWRNGIQAKARTYARHRAVQFYWSGGISTGNFKMLLILSSEGRWSRLLPMPLQQIALDQFNAFTALRERTGGHEQLKPRTETRDATHSGVQPTGSIETHRHELSCLLLLTDTELNTIEEF